MNPIKQNEADYHRLLAQERLILDVTVAVVQELDGQGISRQELAQRLGKSKSFVTQILSGERNMTLRTVADLSHALGRRFYLTTESPPQHAAPRVRPSPARA